MAKYQDYLFDDVPAKHRGCDHPGCSAAGDFRAPKTRALNSYYWFCLEHVRAYNKAWDYFAGSSAVEIEDAIRYSSVWERPTWPMGEWQKREQSLRDKVFNDFQNDAGGSQAPPPHPTMPVAEREALAALDLIPPITFEAIKAQYRSLVKRYHPDAHGGAPEMEEKFKTINHAFSFLKQIYAGEGVE